MDFTFCGTERLLEGMGEVVSANEHIMNLDTFETRF